MRDISLRSIYLALLSPIVGVADTSPEGGSNRKCSNDNKKNCGVILNDKPQFFNSVFNQPFIRSA